MSKQPAPQPNMDFQAYDQLNIKDREDNSAIINIVPSWLATQIEVIPDATLDMDFDSLKKQAKPDETEEKLRISFWNEYSRVIHHPRMPNMNMTNVCGGVCSLQAFKKLAEHSKYKLAYILTPPPTLDLALEEIIQLGFTEMKAIMKHPCVDPRTGAFNARLAQVKYKIFTDVATKRYGSNSTLHIKSQSVHAHFTPQPAQPQQPLSSVDVEAALAEQTQLNAPAQAINTTSTYEQTVAVINKSDNGQQK